METTSFKILEIKPIQIGTKNMVHVTVEMDGKTYVYARRNLKNSFVINGFRIRMNGNYEVVDIEEIYKTKGKKNLKSNIKKEVGRKVQEIKPEPQIEGEIKEEAESGTEEPEQEPEVEFTKYEMLKTCIVNNIPVYIAGPAGSGKNYSVEEIAFELGWNFYFSNSVQQEYKLTGFIDAGGRYHDTEFYKACHDSEDCIFFLDEMDASIPEVLVLLNAAIANGYFEFPNGKVDIEHVHFVAAGNTTGDGADEMYTGRMIIDQASLDRFAIIEWDYDMEVEMELSEGNSELVDFIEILRRNAKENGVRATFSYRCIIYATKLLKTGMPLKDIFRIAIFKGLDKDTIQAMNISYESKLSMNYRLSFQKMLDKM